MKVFETTYKGRSIRVENMWFSGEKLFIDDQLQDENLGISLRGSLFGELKDQTGRREGIKATVGGFFTIQCKIFVDNKCIYPLD